MKRKRKARSPAKKRKVGRPPKNLDPDGFSPDLDGVAEYLGISLRALHNGLKRFPRDRPKHRAGGPYPLRAYKNWADHHGITGRRKQEDLVEEQDIRLRRDRLRLAREEFEFEQLKERMLPMGEVESAIAKVHAGFNAALLAFEPRINEQLEGLDYNDRAIVIRREVELLRKTFRECNYLEVDGDDEELD